MSNVFDQFDASPNPFDQFDPRKKVPPAAATTSPGPAPDSSAPPQPGPNVVPSPNAAPIPPPAPPSPDTNKGSFTSGLLNHLKNFGQQAGNVAGAATDLATFGYGDKALAGINSLVGSGDYASNLAELRKQTNAGYSEHPYLSYGAGLGTLALGGPPSLAAKAAPYVGRGALGLLGRAGLWGAEGAGQGALTAAGHDEDVGTGAVIGGALGPVAQAAGSAITYPLKKIGGAIADKVPIPTTDDLLYAKNNALDKLKEFYYGRKDLTAMTKAASNDMAMAGVNDLTQKTYPKAYGILKDWTDYATQGNNLKQANIVEDKLRDYHTRLQGASGPDQDAGRLLTQRIEDLQRGANPTTVNGPATAQEGAAALDAYRQATQKHTASTYLDQLQEQRGLPGQTQPQEQAAKWVTDPNVRSQIAPLPEQQKSLMQIAQPSGARRAAEAFSRLPYYAIHPLLMAAEGVGGTLAGVPLHELGMGMGTIHGALRLGESYAGNKASQLLTSDIENARRSLVGATNPTPTGLSRILQDPQQEQRIRSLLLRGGVNATTQ